MGHLSDPVSKVAATVDPETMWKKMNDQTKQTVQDLISKKDPKDKNLK